MQHNELSPPEKAQRTAQWAKTMAKWLIAFTTKGRRPWQIVSFEGPKGEESRGIVDLLAIRKDHTKPAMEPLKRGDLFEIVLIQAKGGDSPEPSEDDINRLKEVAERYRAKDIILADWKKGSAPTLYSYKEYPPRKKVEPEHVFR